MVRTDVKWSLFTTRKLLTSAYALTHKIHAEEEILRLDKAYRETNNSFGVPRTPGVGKAIHEREEKIKDLRKQRDMIDAEILRRSQ